AAGSAALIASNSVAQACELVRIVGRSTWARARSTALGGTLPGLRRAAPRTHVAARCSASVAMPVHNADHRMCEYGTIVSAEESANEPGTICSGLPWPENLAPGLQVPRMPSVSQVPVCSSV